MRSAKHLLNSGHVAQFSEKIAMTIPRMSEKLIFQLQWILCSFDGILLSAALKHILKHTPEKGKGKQREETNIVAVFLIHVRFV